MCDRHLSIIEGHEIDLFPYAEEALRVCPYETDLTPTELVGLIEMEVNRKYISVAWQDRVEGRNLYWPIRWVLTRTRRITFDWPNRFAQMTDPDIRKLRPYIELTTEHVWCLRAQSMRGKWLRPEELEPLPFPECDKDRCWCQFRTRSRRDIERGGA